MGLVYLILFAFAEILLVVLTCTKFNEKTRWITNRAIIRAAEAVLLVGIVLIPAVHMKWRFAAAIIVLAIRCVFDGIMWLVRHKKIQGQKKAGWSIVNCLVSILLIAVTLIPSFIFSNYNGLPTTGKYQVKTADAILVDKSRPDTFENDGSFREVPAHFFYPDSSDGNYPLVVFSHGAFGYYQSNFSTYEELASNGYVVAALDHPHHSFFSNDTSGKTVIVDSEFMNNVMGINDTTSEEKIYEITKSWMKLRTDDENFVLDTIQQAKASGSLSDAWYTENADTILSVLSKTDTDKIGLFGHSLGGATSAAVGRERNDIDAVIVLDGTMLGERVSVNDGKSEYIREAYPVPILDFTKEIDYNDREQFKDKNGYAYVNEYVIDNAVDGKTVVFSGVGHMDFTDLPLISPTIASMLGSGNIDHEKTLNTINGLVLDWFNYYLKNEGTLDIQAKY